MNRFTKHQTWACLLAACLTMGGACMANEESMNPVSPWPAIDGLGRILPDAEAVGPPRTDRFVGIFYFLWNGVHNQTEVHDVSKILKEKPDALKDPASPPWGPEGYMHFWGEPLFGYYRNHDPWTLRRHANLLADAGIDTLIFDTTNRATYHDVYMKLCEVFTQVRADGGRTPQIAFMCNTEAGATAAELYNDLYKPGKYQDLWFRWKGKPLMICDPQTVSPEIKEFFTLRKAHWPFEMINTPYAWHWEAAYPQPYGYTEDPEVPEQINVSVAQNLRAADGKVTNMSNGDARGRSFHEGVEDTDPDAVNHGYNFQEQWERAIQLNPPFVMVTGWNEWIAGKYSRPDYPVVFVDQYNQEFSRDIEPVLGAHGDNYYWQLIANVRRYKGCPSIPKASGAKSIQLNGDFSQWNTVQPEYMDHVGDTLPRDHVGVGKNHYVNQSGRNEFRLMKVSSDAGKVYFYARTAAPITSAQDPNWMMLLLDVDGDMKNGWEGFDYIVNRKVKGEKSTMLEKNAGGWNWEPAAEIQFEVKGNEMHLAIPREALGLMTDPVRLDFKWLDNPQKPGDVMDIYLSGDAAPQGRFRYRYQAE